MPFITKQSMNVHQRFQFYVKYSAKHLYFPLYYLVFYEISPTLAGPFVMAIPEFLLTLKAVANQEVIASGTVEEIIAEPLALKARSDSYAIKIIEAHT